MAFPVAEQRIVEAESGLGRRLPQDFRARLMRENGGEIVVEDDDWMIHPVWDPTNRKTMGRTASHILTETESARSWSSFPKDGISLASDGCGNRLIVRGSGDELFAWQHSTGECLSVKIDWQ